MTLCLTLLLQVMSGVEAPEPSSLRLALNDDAGLALPSGPDDAPLQEPHAAERVPIVALYARLRAGAWASNGFAFEAVVGSVERTIDTHALFSLGLDGGAVFHDHILAFFTYEANVAEHVFSDLVGLSLGYRERTQDPNPLVPREVALYAGGIWGRFDVLEDDFGTFENSFGVRAGLSLGWTPARGIMLSVIGEYRLIEFEYNEEVTDGDDRAGGSTVWVGLGLDLDF